MATQAPTEFEDLTTCTVCLETFTRPKRLPCEHSYCYACLLLLGKDNTTITCPYCQEEHEIPDSGVSGFKDNLLLNNLVGMTLPKIEICADCKKHPSADHICEHCCKKLCGRCLVEHTKLSQEVSISLSQLKDNLTTASSQDKRLKLATHRNNLEGERRKMNELFRSEAVKKLIGVKILLERANFMDKAMGNVTELYEVLENEDREAAIESYITKLLGKSSECVTADSLTDLRKNLTDLKTVLRLIETQDEQFEFRYSLEEGFQQLEFGQAVMNVKGKYQTENIVDQITQLVQDSAGILRDHVTTTCPPRADHVVPLPAMTKTADADTQTENRFQEPEPEKKITDGSAAAAVTANSSPKQGVTLKPKLPAVKKYVQNQLPRHVDYAGKGGDEVVVIGQGESVKEENRLDYPRGCAYHVDRDEIFVTDWGNHRIMAYRADGTNARVVYTDVMKPLDVAVSSDGQFMYIAAPGALIKVDMDGHTVRTINKFSLGDFRLCCSVTCYQEYTVVVDHDHECVIVYNDREEELRCFGQGDLKDPTSVAISDERKFYVADLVGSCVKVFDWSGEYLQVFAGTGSTGDIWGIAVDGDGNVCISRPGSNRIDIYNPQKKLVTSITGAGPGELKFPWGVCLTPDGRLLVADHANNRVQVF